MLGGVGLLAEASFVNPNKLNLDPDPGIWADSNILSILKKEKKLVSLLKTKKCIFKGNF